MIRLVEYPKKSFKSKAEALRFLKDNEAKIAQIKCSQVMKSFEKGSAGILPYLTIAKGATKEYSFVKDGNFYPVINTTNWLDSHLDVHLDGIWNRSIDQNQGKLYYVDTHSLKMGDVIAWPEDVKSFTRHLSWSDLGKNIEGETQALIYEIPEDKIEHEGAKKVVVNKRKVENSVRMQYVKIRLAINNPEEDFKENKAIWDEVYPKIANKETADEYGYFWAVYEAKIFKEGSMVLAGSNEMTPIIYEKDEPGAATSSKGPAIGASLKTDPPNGTQFDVSEAIQKLKFNF